MVQLVFFLVEVRGFEPRSTRPYSALSTRLVGDWIVSRFGSPTNLASMISCWQQSYREIRLRCLFFWRRLPRKQKTSGRRADLNYAARANSILELFWLFFAFNFNVPFLRSRAYDVLIPHQTECRIQNTPESGQSNRLGALIIPHSVQKSTRFWNLAVRRKSGGNRLGREERKKMRLAKSKAHFLKRKHVSSWWLWFGKCQCHLSTFLLQYSRFVLRLMTKLFWNYYCLRRHRCL